MYVAKFNDDGTSQWIPLIAGQGALANWTQAEICINTHGAADQVGATKNDGIYAVPVEGPHRGWLRQFLSGPRGSEICGPEFTPDNLTLFCAIQHPGEGGTVNNPVSVWPDGVSPARPSVVAIFNSDDNIIGS